MNVSQQVRRGRNIPAIGPFILRTGWAAPYRDAPDGRRQLFGIMLPGERSSTRDGTLVSALTDCTVEPFDWSSTKVGEVEPPLTWFDAYDEMTKWMFILGHGNSVARVAFLIRNLEQRIKILGGSTKNGFRLEIRQSDIAEFCCISTIHVNRAIRYLDRTAVISRDGKFVTITNAALLSGLADLRIRGVVERPEREPHIIRLQGGQVGT